MTRKARGRVDWSTFQATSSIVVPVFNEAENVLALVKRIRAAVNKRRVEVLFIDDSPKTDTANQVELAKSKFESKNFSVQLYRRTGQQRWGGLSGAVVDGINRAQSDRIVVMDGDLQHPPETLPAIFKAAQNHDLVVASRYCQGGSAKGLDGRFRHLVSRGSTLLAKIFFPLRLRRITDPMTGFFFVNRKEVDASRLHPKGFKILMEILATHPKLKVTEVPMQFAERVAGKSNGMLKMGLEYLSQLVSLRTRHWINMLNRLPKLVLFGLIGGSVFCVGMALLFVLVEVLGLSPLAANAVQLAVTFWLNYSLNRNITWHERRISPLAAHKFLISRATTTGINYLLFAWLISQPHSFSILNQTVSFSVNYLVANVVTLILVTAINYVVSDRWAFAEPKKKSQPYTSKPLRKRLSPGVALIAILISVVAFSLGFNTVITLSILMVLISFALFLQASMEVWRLVYAYREPDSIDRLRFPKPETPREKFCILVPARHEAAVLSSTLHQLAQQTHPNVNIIAVICDDDYETLQIAEETALLEPRVRVLRYPLMPNVKPSKPKQLNYAFGQIKDSSYTVIGVIDAEDTIHPELLRHIDSAFHDREVGVVQGGVQLMNHDSSWYSLHNVLEYYRWFNSTLSFQADNKFIPLGGNTIFIRKKFLLRAGGWPETLTEDCSLGVLLSTRYHTKTAVYYEPELATREETPDSLKALFKQRVRWNQGFFHEWRKGVWHELPNLRQRLLADYVLISPVFMPLISLMIPISLFAALYLDAPVGLVMLMYLPLIPAILQLVLNGILLHDFGKAFDRKIYFRHYAVLVATQIAYQFILNIAAFWAVVRELKGEHSWDKTPHLGKHRVEQPTHVRLEKRTIKLIEETSDAKAS